MFEQGWMNDSTAGGFDDSMSAPSAAKRSKKSEPIVPVTCQDIHDVQASDEKVLIGNREFNQVTLVAKLQSVKQESGMPHRDFELLDDDEGKPIIARLFTGEGLRSRDFIEGSYVRVYGRLRHFGDGDAARYVTAYNMLPADEDEYNCHQGEVQLAKLYYEKSIGERVSADVMNPDNSVLANSWFAPLGAANKGGGGGGSFGTPLASSTQMPLPLPGTPAPRIGEDLGSATAGLPALDKQIVQLIAAHGKDSEHGMALESLVTLLGGTLSREFISERVETLAQDGFVYSTNDETHYKVL